MSLLSNIKNTFGYSLLPYSKTILDCICVPILPVSCNQFNMQSLLENLSADITLLLVTMNWKNVFRGIKPAQFPHANILVWIFWIMDTTMDICIIFFFRSIRINMQTEEATMNKGDMTVRIWLPFSNMFLCAYCCLYVCLPVQNKSAIFQMCMVGYHRHRN